MNTGSAYYFDLASIAPGNPTIYETEKIVLSYREENDTFGYSVGTSGSTLIVGALEFGTDSGSAYLYSVAAVPEVSATGALAASGSLLALMAFLWERQFGSPVSLS